MMKTRERRIEQAWLEEPSSGIIELCHDWRSDDPPPLHLNGGKRPLESLFKLPDYRFGEESGYFVRRGEIWFLVDPARHPIVDWKATPVYLAGDVNGWQEAIGSDEWRLRKSTVAGREVYVLKDGADRHFEVPHLRFKFVTQDHIWLEVPEEAPNRAVDANGNRNREVHPQRTGQHRFAFTTERPVNLSDSLTVSWKGEGFEQRVPLRLGEFFYRLKSELPLGAIVEGTETVFRLFAPRARRVRLYVQQEPGAASKPQSFLLKKNSDGTWAVRLDRNLHGWFYWYTVDGPRNVFGHFEASARILDPYALAVLGREGPGIVLERAWMNAPKVPYSIPAWHDLVITEIHVRDIAAMAPIKARPEERLGFTGLTKWVNHPDFYLARLGVNAVELQPIQEFDSQTREEYHWGYMPVNFFSPSSAYGLQPERASQVREFQELVNAFHRRSMAVILDVVYNHVGVPAHLMFIDKLYYFEVGRDGELSNWSGCGNDLRCRSAMARRLVIDSLVHLVEVYDVDGFRFDLAELIGIEVLEEIERELKKVKPGIILIAEPWSFRGHIAGALRRTGYASWNDGYRNFVRDYVRGMGTAGGMEYFLKGSPWHFARFPAQTVNYTASHDDRTWLDTITENPDHNGQLPTLRDVRRTHLMIAILMASIGMPMMAQGQDLLFSKRGVNNTYQRGDLNALDYKRMYRYPSTHAYFVDWIAFRQSPSGRLFRLESRPSEGFFRFFFAPDLSAMACIYNADGSHGRLRLLFAVNPHDQDVTLPLKDGVGFDWRQLADHDCFFRPGSSEPQNRVSEDLFLPALGCGLWVSE